MAQTQPIRITKQTGAVLPWVGDDTTRYALQTVRFDPDGRTVACNGAGLCLLRHSGDFAVEDYPTAFFPVQIAPLTAPVLLPADNVAQVMKAIPKHVKRGSLLTSQNAVQVVNSNGHITIGITDLSTAQTFEIQPSDATYPDIERVIPMEAPTVTIGISVAYLSAVVESLKTIGAKTVALSVTDSLKAMVWDAKGDDANVKIVLMPVRV